MRRYIIEMYGVWDILSTREIQRPGPDNFLGGEVYGLEGTFEEFPQLTVETISCQQEYLDLTGHAG